MSATRTLRAPGGAVLFSAEVRPRERGAVLAETLRGGAGHGNAERRTAAVLLGAGGGVDDDALADAGGADEDRGALGAGDDLERVGLLA